MRKLATAAAVVCVFAGSARGDSPAVVCHESPVAPGGPTWGIGSTITCAVDPTAASA